MACKRNCSFPHLCARIRPYHKSSNFRLSADDKFQNINLPARHHSNTFTCSFKPRILLRSPLHRAIIRAASERRARFGQPPIIILFERARFFASCDLGRFKVKHTERMHVYKCYGSRLVVVQSQRNSNLTYLNPTRKWEILAPLIGPQSHVIQKSFTTWNTPQVNNFGNTFSMGLPAGLLF